VVQFVFFLYCNLFCRCLRISVAASPPLSLCCATTASRLRWLNDILVTHTYHIVECCSPCSTISYAALHVTPLYKELNEVYCVQH